MTSYGQNGEDLFLAEHFGDRTDGRFLDIGAHLLFSNSRALVERGWSGVCVEPSPTPFLALLELYKDRPGVELVNVAVAAEAGLAAWFDSGGDAVSSLNTAHVAKWAAGGSVFRRWTVATTTPAALLDRFPGPYDVMNLDIEGSSADLLLSFPLDRMGLSVLCIEHDGKFDQIKSFCANAGLTQELSRNSENLIMARPLRR